MRAPLSNAAPSQSALLCAVLCSALLSDDLPNRDCHALASNGEVCCEYNEDGATCNYDTREPTCRVGLAKYKSEYVDAFAAMLKAHAEVPTVVILEPDSLPNMATNLDQPRCGNAATQAAYIQGLNYALEALHTQAPHATLYLDAGHGGWLGWPQGADRFAALVRSLGQPTDSPGRGSASRWLRGFATNVANYQSLGEPCPAVAFANVETVALGQWCGSNSWNRCCDDPCNLLSQFNSANNELNYVQVRQLSRDITDCGSECLSVGLSDCLCSRCLSPGLSECLPS